MQENIQTPRKIEAPFNPLEFIVFLNQEGSALSKTYSIKERFFRSFLIGAKRSDVIETLPNFISQRRDVDATVARIWQYEPRNFTEKTASEGDYRVVDYEMRIKVLEPIDLSRRRTISPQTINLSYSSDEMSVGVTTTLPKPELAYERGIWRFI